MSDEKNFNEENEETASEETTETVEETVEAVEETVEDAVEDAVVTDSAESVLGETDEIDADNDAEVSEAVAAAQVAFQSVQDTENKKSSKGAIIAIIVAAVLVVALIVFSAIKFGPMLFNKYNRQGYVDVSGRTISEVAEQSGMELSEFLSQYGLPENMPGNTSESAAYNNIPLSNMAQMYGMDFATMQETLKLPEDITEDTPWGEAIGKTTLGAYVGEDSLAEFKEYYGLGEEITADTLWGEVRQTVDEKSRQERIESEKAAKESTDSETTENAPIDAATETTDVTAAPVDATQAPAA